MDASRRLLTVLATLEDLSDDELQAVSARALCLLLDRPVDPAGSLLDVEVVAHEESRLLGGYRALAPRATPLTGASAAPPGAGSRRPSWACAAPPASPHARHAPTPSGRPAVPGSTDKDDQHTHGGAHVPKQRATQSGAKRTIA